MDMEYYRNFIAIVEAGSLSAASKRVHVAQPALSNQLKLLQKKFGTQLVNIRRGVHNIELTNAGCILYNKAKYLCSLEDDTQREISDCVNGYTGTLRVSLSPSMSISFIQTYLSKFSKEYPQINYELYEVSILEQINQMLTGKTERLVAVMHKDNPWLPADDKALLLAHMEDMPICLSRGCSTLFLNVCSDSMIFPQILSINSTKLSTIAWAKENAGIAVVPASPGEIFDNDLICKIIRDDRLFLNKTLSIVKGRPLSNVAQLFLNYFSQHS